MNQLTNNFVLIKTYEQTMKQYEHELENFKLRTQQFEEEQAILIQKNSDLGQQLYVMKTRISKGGDPFALTSTDEEKIERIEKDQMVSLLKKNLDNLIGRMYTKVILDIHHNYFRVISTVGANRGLIRGS